MALAWSGISSASAQTIVQGPIVNPINGHTYYRLSNSNWSQAEAAAIGLGGHLVSISDAAENSFVLNTFANAPGSGPVWLGLTDQASEGSFAYTNGDEFGYSNWESGEPNNAGGNEHYVAMYSGNGRWVDVADLINPPGIGQVYGVIELSTTQPPFELKAAYPVSNTDIRAVFTEALDPASAGDASHYSFGPGLPILAATFDPESPNAVTLHTGMMVPANLRSNALHISNISSQDGDVIVSANSRSFVEGILTPQLIQSNREPTFPFNSLLVPQVASVSCAWNDWHRNSNCVVAPCVIESVGGPYSGVAVSLTPATTALVTPYSFGTHLLFAGGVMTEVNGETQVADTGFMEAFPIGPDLPLPQPVLLSTADMPDVFDTSEATDQFERCYVEFRDVQITDFDPSTRVFLFRDASGVIARGDLNGLDEDAQLFAGQALPFLRGVVIVFASGRYKVMPFSPDNLPVTCQADLNGDGALNSQDFFDFVTAFFALQPIADFNDDTFINSQDFFDFLVAFFAGC